MLRYFPLLALILLSQTAKLGCERWWSTSKPAEGRFVGNMKGCNRLADMFGGHHNVLIRGKDEGSRCLGLRGEAQSRHELSKQNVRHALFKKISVLFVDPLTCAAGTWTAAT
jgi:hypothetical protein